MLAELKAQKATIEEQTATIDRLNNKIEADQKINALIGDKIKEYAEQKAPAKTWLGMSGNKKGSQ